MSSMHPALANDTSRGAATSVLLGKLSTRHRAVSAGRRGAFS